MIKKICSGISAGICIALGGSVFLACDNKYVGAVLFSVALLCICIEGYSLYTGKICFILEKHGKEEIGVLLWGLLGNLIATVVCGLLIRFAISPLGEKAEQICKAKMNQPLPSTLIRAVFCGILIYLAVDIFRKNKNVVGIVFCIPVFILSGFEHSVADMFYFSAAADFNVFSGIFILTVIIGNSIGGMLIPKISLIGKKDVVKF